MSVNETKLPDLYTSKWEALKRGYGTLPSQGVPHSTGERPRQDPIASAREDRLDRATFAGLMGRALVRYSSNQSYVVALNGKYGTGKTSVINMALDLAYPQARDAEEILDGGAETRPIVFRFEPVLYSTTGDLYVQFFSKFGERLEVDFRLRGLKGLLTAFGLAIKPAGRIVDASTGQSGFFSTLGAALSRSSQRVGNWLQQRERDPAQLKEHISRILASGDRRVIVVIDDIDRLTPEEVRDIFRLVKAVADFPNTLYLLAFDLDAASKALSKVQGVDGVEYMEKIIQAPFRLPEVEEAQLLRLLLEGVLELADNSEMVSEEDRNDLLQQSFYLNYLGLDRLVGSMRQANRVLDALEFTLPAIADEVRLRDFVILEVFRICHPLVYQRLLERRDYFVGVGNQLYGRNLVEAGEKEEIATTVENALDHVSSAVAEVEVRRAVSNLLRELFPLAQWAHQRHGFGGGEFVTQWQNDRRVCAPDVFRTATSWTLPKHVAPAGLVQELAGLDDADELRRKLSELLASSETRFDVAQVVFRLADLAQRERNPTSSIEVVIGALLGLEEPGALAGTIGSVCKDLLLQLRHRSSVESSDNLLKRCMESYSLTPTMVHLLRDIADDGGYRTQSPSPGNVGYVSSETVNELFSSASERLDEMEYSELFSKDEFDHYLYLWAEILGANDKGRELLLDAISDREGLLLLTRSYIKRSDAAYHDALYVQIDNEPDAGLRLQILKHFDLLRETQDQINNIKVEELPSEGDRQAFAQLRAYIRAEMAGIDEHDQRRPRLEGEQQSEN